MVAMAASPSFQDNVHTLGESHLNAMDPHSCSVNEGKKRKKRCTWKTSNKVGFLSAYWKGIDTCFEGYEGGGRKYYGAREGTWWKNDNRDQKWNRRVNSWSVTERNEGWRRGWMSRDNLERMKETERKTNSRENNRKSLFVAFPISFLTIPAPILCPACLSEETLSTPFSPLDIRSAEGQTGISSAGLYAAVVWTWMYLSSWLCPESLP